MDSADRESLRQCAQHWIDAGWEIHVLHLNAHSHRSVLQCEVHDAVALLPIVTTLKDQWQSAIAVVVVRGDHRQLEAHLAYVMDIDGNGYPVRLLNLRIPWERFRVELTPLHLSIREIRNLHEYVPR